MRLAAVGGRVHVVIDDRMLVDVETASEGRFSHRVQEIYHAWDEFRVWAAGDIPTSGATDLVEERLEAPVEPRQVFAIGLNYADHADESGTATPPVPQVFTKFPACIGAPNAELVLPTEFVDWEVELVAVIGRRAERVSASQAWTHVAGLTIGQDYSERRMQMAGEYPQYSLPKSFPGFAPVGPVVVTPDELENPEDLAIECRIDGEVVQSARTSQMMHSIPRLIEWISAICPMYPGDLVFSGTPAGVGFARQPERFLKPGEQVESTIESIGTIRQRCIASEG